MHYHLSHYAGYSTASSLSAPSMPRSCRSLLSANGEMLYGKWRTRVKLSAANYSVKWTAAAGPR